jgi:hypothetical protein
VTRTVATLAVVAALLIAGCGGGGGGTTSAPPADDPTAGDGPGSTPGATATTGSDATTVPGDATPGDDGPDDGDGGPDDGDDGDGGDGTAVPTATATPQDPATIDLPPGVADGRVADPAALVDAHESRLSTHSGRQYLGWQRSDSGARRLWVLDRGPGGTVFERRTGPNTTRYWTDGDSVTYRLSTEGEGTVDRVVATGPAALRDRFAGRVAATGDELLTYLRIAEWEVVGRTVHDGRAVVELNLTEIDVTGLANSDFEGEDRELAALSGTAYVTEDGLITEMEVDADFIITFNDTRYTERFRATVTNVGATSADRPGWYDEAPHVDADYVADGRALELTHRAGAPLAWTTELTVYRAGATDPDGVVEVPESIREGDSLYLYAVSVDGDLQYRIVTERSAIPDDAIQLSDRGAIRVEATVDGITVVYATDAEG